MARYTTDVIGSCVFGIKSDSIDDPNCHFREMGRKLLETNLIHAFKTILTRLLPEVSKARVNKLLTIKVSTAVSLSILHQIANQISVANDSAAGVNSSDW
jgi:hypothetical protein